MNRKERRAAQKRGQSRAPASAQALGHAAALAQAGQLFTAEAVAREYLAAHPGDLEAEHLLGQIALAGGRPDLAAERFGRTAAAGKNPQYACDLAGALHLSRRSEEATGVLARAAEQWPSDIRVATSLAAILSDQGRHAEAIAAHRRVVSLRPESAAAHNGLGAALLAAGDRAEAGRHLLEAMQRAPAVLDSYGNVVSTLNALKPDLMSAVGRASKAWPQRLALAELAGPDGMAGLAGDALLRWLLESHTVCDLALERWIAGLRYALLVAMRDDRSDDEAMLRLSCTLARQGFLNDYLFATTPEEDTAAASVRDGVAAALAAGRPAPPMALAAAAMYHPLGAIPGAEALAGEDLPEPLAAVVRQQVIEPRTEAADRAAIPRLTAISQDVSIAVQRQYEESPYPRWVYPWSDPWSAGPPETVPAVLRRIFPHAELRGLRDEREADVLISGCGTGRHAVEFARSFQRVRITAIDLSLTSLAYARRRTAELNISNISYGQADLIEFAALGRAYDVVDASGVLHHLADPFAGWRLMLSLVRPGGVMKVGLYSEVARRSIVAAREWIAERGIASTPENIRRIRHELADGDFSRQLQICPDFYSVSECRDLLFHVQEHHLTLPAVAAFLAEQTVTFLGFTVAPLVRDAYRRRFPDDPAMISLDRWHRFETENPETFFGMYQFWIEKRP